MATYSKHSIDYLQVDAHLNMVESTLKGYMKWVGTLGSSSQQDVGFGKDTVSKSANNELGARS